MTLPTDEELQTPHATLHTLTPLIDHFYADAPDLRHILLAHSRSVARKALAIARAHPELQLDADFLLAAAMLHDIGIIRCHAPAICCHGTEPYICHGREGAAMLRALRGTALLPAEAIEPLARVCERHTGAGLTRRDIIAQQLPLPPQDFLPETTAEQVVCYADKFFSKTRLDREKSVDEAAHSLAKFGANGVERFRQWALRFE